MIFRDRRHAGKLLGKKLLTYQEQDPLILALPRGGVPVAAEVARMLGASLDVLVVRKIGAPFQPELAVGAISEDGEPLWNEHVLARVGLAPEDLTDVVQKERSKVREQIRRFREDLSLPDLKGKAVVLVDDGLATGATMAAGIRFLRGRGVKRILIAVPIAAASSIRQLRERVDEIIVLEEKEDLRSVGQWYHDFNQVSDAEVGALLKESREKVNPRAKHHEVKIDFGTSPLKGELTLIPEMKAMIVFAHGSGSSRRSPRNRQVANFLNSHGYGTFLFDLLSEEEAANRENVFDLNLLAERLAAVTSWLQEQKIMEKVPTGFFGASTGAGAAIRAAALLSGKIYAIVSRGGRPDLAGPSLQKVGAPTLMIVGGKDEEVLRLNRQAQEKMLRAEIALVPGATHLFEEKGALEEVSSLALNWFERQLPPKMNYDSRARSLVEAAEASLISLAQAEGLDRLIESIKDQKIVMLGESSHGTEEFYRLRALISQKLIAEHGFRFIAVEGDWPDAGRLQRYIRRGVGGSAKEVLMRNHRWPTWMWANDEIVRLAEWMKDGSAGFYGLDVYSLFESIEEVTSYLKASHPELAREVEKRYACFEPFEKDEIAYAKSLIRFPEGCEKEVLKNLQTILEIRARASRKNEEEVFSSEQNAWVVANAETYYRAMLKGDADSWNTRDIHMLETLGRLLEKEGPNAKAIVWAHNTHIGDYRATDMDAGGYVNLGGLARQTYGPENVALVGFSTYSGTVLASPSWDGPEQEMILPPARLGSYEHGFHQVSRKTGNGSYFISLRGTEEPAFQEERGQRAVGVVYETHRESRGHYVPTKLAQRYDAFVFIDQTRTLHSLHSSFVRGALPETWPSGL